MTDLPALLRPELPSAIDRQVATLSPGSSWTPASRTGTLILVLAGHVSAHDHTGAATFGPGSLLPSTAATPLTLHNPGRVPAALITFTRTTREH